MAATDFSKITRDRVIAKLTEKANSKTAFTNPKKPTTKEIEPDFIVPETGDSTDSEKGGVWYGQTFAGGDAYLKETGAPDIEISSLIHNREEWSKDDQIAIPELDGNYIWQHEVLYPAIHALLHNMKVLTVGPTGSGKTTFWKNMAAVFNQPFYRLGGRSDMESDSILGRPDIQDGNMNFLLGEFPKAFTNGYLILWDEIWKVPAGINMALQRVLERGGYLQIDDMPGDLEAKTFRPHKSTHIAMADNVVGTGDGADKYAATMIQDGSTINRVDMVLHLDYLSPDAEVKMLTGMYPYIPAGKANKAVQLANLIRKGYNDDHLSVTMSPRNLTAWMELAYKVSSYESAFKWTMLQRFAEDDEKAAVRGFWQTIFGTSL